MAKKPSPPPPGSMWGYDMGVAKRAELVSEFDEMLEENRALLDKVERDGRSSLTAAEDRTYKAIKDATVEHQENLAELDRTLAEHVETYHRTVLGATPPPTSRDHHDSRRRGTDDVTARAISAVEGSRYIADERRSFVIDELERNARSENPDGVVPAWAIAASSDYYLEAITTIVADPVAGHLKLTEPQRASIAAMTAATRAMSTVDASGGYLSLPLAVDPAVRIANNGALNPLGALASTTILNQFTDTWRSPYTAGVTASWDGEAGTVSDDSPTFSAADIKAWKWQAFAPYSIEIGADVQGFAEEMAALLADAADRLEADALMSGAGDGSNQPKGLITALDSNTNVEVVVTTDGAFGLVDVFKLHKALPARYRAPGANTAWLAHVGVIDQIRQLVMAQNSGNSLWTDLSATEPPLLLGHPIYEVTSGLGDFTGTTGAANILCIGGFKDAYKVVRRAPTQIELLPMLYDVTTNRPTGQRGFYAWGRTGGSTIVETAARLLQNT